MNPFLSQITQVSTFHGFQVELPHLIAQVQAADTATLLSWLEYGVVILGVLLFGVFPVLALLTAALTLAGLPLLCRGRTPDRIRRFLGISDARVPQARAALEAHLTDVRSDLPRTLVWLLAISLFPFVGIVVGLTYYRLSPVAVLRSEIVIADLGLLRWLLPLAAAGFVIMQPLPVIGPLSLPLLYATYHAVYDTTLKRRQVSEGMLPIAA